MVERVIHLVAAPGSGANVVAALLSSTVPPDVVACRWNPLEAVDIASEALHPNARFMLVVREPETTVAMAMQAWASREFVSHPELAGWWGDPWSFPLIDNWQHLIGAPSVQVCAQQYSALVTGILDQLADLPDDRWSVVSLERLSRDPDSELVRALADIGVSWSGGVTPGEREAITGHIEAGALARRVVLEEVEPELATVRPVVDRLRRVVAERIAGFAWEVSVDEVADDLEPRASEGTPFSSHFTPAVPELLALANASLVVTTYKSGHVIMVRADGAVVNTEFTAMPRPMGVAVAGPRLAIGTAETIACFTLNNGLAGQVPSARTPDSVYAPRSIVFTGDVAIHDMAYGADGALYFVNTRFSCLCRQDIDYSFVPVWRPSWISGLAAEDRCHLNGLALFDGVPRYVTALSRTDTPGGWRELAGTSGVVVDVTTNEVIAEGLSMPHSPRWHEGRLWVLESGLGALITIDPVTGARTVVASLPGFTRGLSFIGPYALVGLSQVRESVFASLPITATAAERNCGVWVVDTRTGEVAGLLRFEGVVQEIFEVAVVAGKWPVLIEPGEVTMGSYVLPDDALRDVAGD